MRRARFQYERLRTLATGEDKVPPRFVEHERRKRRLRQTFRRNSHTPDFEAQRTGSQFEFLWIELR